MKLYLSISTSPERNKTDFSPSVPPFKRQGVTTLFVFPSTLRGWAPYREPIPLWGRRQAQHPDWTCHSSERWPQQSSDSKPLDVSSSSSFYTVVTTRLPRPVSGSTLTSSSLDFHPGPAPTVHILILPLTHTFLLPVDSITFTVLPGRNDFSISQLCVPSWCSPQHWELSLLPQDSCILLVNLAHVTLSISRGSLAFLCFQ